MIPETAAERARMWHLAGRLTRREKRTHERPLRQPATQAGGPPIVQSGVQRAYELGVSC